MSQKIVINVSELCQKIVQCKYLSEFDQKSFGNASEMCYISKMCYERVPFFIRKNLETFDWFFMKRGDSFLIHF